MKNKISSQLSRIFRLNNESQLMVRNMFVIFSFVIIGKVIGVAKEILIANHYGINATLDGYAFVFTIVNFPISIWYSVLSATFIPLIVKLSIEEPEAIAQFRSELFGFSLIIGLLLGLAGLGILTWYFKTDLSGLSEEARYFARQSTYWLAALIPFGILTHYGSVLMMSENKHLNTLFESLPSLSIIVALLIAGSSTNIAPLLWGTFAGAFLHMIVMLCSSVRSNGLGWPRLSFKSRFWKLLFTGIGIMLVGQILQSILGLIDQLFAARLDTGSIATLSYSNRIISLILTLVLTVITRAALPIFSKMVFEGSSQFLPVIRFWTIVTFCIGGVAFALLWYSADYVVKFIFERGAFTAESTEKVANILRYSSLQLPFYLPAIIMIYAALSQGRYAFVTFLALLSLLAKISASLILVPSLGLPGLLLATVLVYVISCAVQVHGFARMKNRED